MSLAQVYRSHRLKPALVLEGVLRGLHGGPRVGWVRTAHASKEGDTQPLTAGTPAPPGTWGDSVQPGPGGAHLGLRSRELEEVGCWAAPGNWVSLSGTSS